MSLITAHVLDAVAGSPAAGVAIELFDGSGTSIASARTDTDGRVNTLGSDQLPAGDYRIVFGTGAYFAAQSQPTFFPEVAISFTVTAGEPHYHIPLLLSPFAYSTYRGS
jgi:5-hydroxyisourate hydrolase